MYFILSNDMYCGIIEFRNFTSSRDVILLIYLYHSLERGTYEIYDTVLHSYIVYDIHSCIQGNSITYSSLFVITVLHKIIVSFQVLWTFSLRTKNGAGVPSDILRINTTASPISCLRKEL